MKKENRVLEFLKHPNGIFLIVVCLVAVGSIAVSVLFAATSYAGPLSYVAYVLAALSLAYSVYLVVRYAGEIKKKAVEKAKKREITRKFVENYGFRTIVFSSVSFAINTGYAIFYGVMGIVVHSLWYGALAGYYIFLSAARIGVLSGGYRAAKRAKDDGKALYVYKLKIFRGCGIFLIVLDIALATAVAQMVMSEPPSAHGEIAAITSAAYAFYKIVLALVNLFKAKNLRDPLVQSLRNVNLTDALVSLLALQTTLVALYSDGDRDMTALNIIVGAAVCFATVAMGVFMIIRACILLKRPGASPPPEHTAAAAEEELLSAAAGLPFERKETEEENAARRCGPQNGGEK